MVTKEIKQTVFFPVSPETVYKALMSSEIQSIFTDSDCRIGENVGDDYDAYDGYIEGTNLELVPYSKIVQSWTAFEDAWPEDHETKVIFELSPKENGTELKFTHENVPENLYDAFYDGWIEHYWEPMKDYFESTRQKS
jgi:uncharacterized protein YndB with AHSA1/START domain